VSILGRARRGLRHGWLGLALIALVWPLNWTLEGMRTHLLFFPLWLGYALWVDGWAYARTGTSLLTRSRVGYAALFLLSVPAWWTFELFNRRLGNWEYLGRAQFSDLEYALLSSLSFSTVVPAVFGTAELARSFAPIERFANGPRVARSPLLLAASLATGLAMLAAMLAWPRIFYPFLWMSGVFLLEPLAAALGRPSLLGDLERRDWRPWMALWAGTLQCGFFWEMWNAYSYPKWIYHVAGVEFAYVFEMPLLGYLGYLPFALELYLLGALILPRAWLPRL
jgi:hypothetical protein